MMRRYLLFAAALTCSAQTPDIHVDVNLFTVGYTVSDRNHAPVADLRREDFTLSDDGQPREIQSFWRESGLPLTVGLIADVSGSQAGLIRKHRQTILQFLTQVMGPQDKAFIATAGVQARLVTDLTGSIDELRAGVDAIGPRAGRQFGEPCTRPLIGPKILLRGPGCGGTVLWDAIYAAASLKMKLLTGRKALIVLSDGLDTGSVHGVTTTIEAAQSADTLVYTIRSLSLMTTLSPGMLVRATITSSMKRVSEETGGRAFSSSGKSSETFTIIEQELRNLYVLGFTPPEDARNGKFRKLEIKTPKPGLSVRARKGYSIPQR